MDPSVTAALEVLGRLADASATTLALFALFALWKGWIIFPGTFTRILQLHEQRYADLERQLGKSEEEREEWKAIAFRHSELSKIVVPIAIEKVTGTEKAS